MKKLLILLTIGINLCANEINQKKLFELEKQNKALLLEVKEFTQSLLGDEETLLKEKLKEFEDDPDTMSAKALNNAMSRALKIAQGYGMDTNKLTSLYNLSKKVILRSEFKEYNSDTKTFTEGKIDEWISWALQGDEKIARDAKKIQDQRLALYKKVTLAYIKALMEKDANKSYNHLKNYTQALQKIQSADADILNAEAELLVSEQKLVADVVSTLPFIGDALDILSIATGEDLSGQKLSDFEKKLNLVLLLTPNIVEQVLKRNPSISRFFGKLIAYSADVKDAKINKFTSLLASEKLKNVIETTFKSRDIDKWRRHYKQKIREQKRLADISQEEMGLLLKESEESLSKSGIKKVGTDELDTKEVLSSSTRKKIDNIAKKKNTVIITRPVNEFANKWIELGASTKDMFVKGKSSSHGLFAGLIPKKQKYSKLKQPNDIDKFQLKVNDSLQGERRYINYTPDEIKAFEKAVQRNQPNLQLGEKFYFKEQMEDILKKEVANPVVGSKQLKLSVNGEAYKAVELPKIGGTEHSQGLVLYKKGDKYYNKNFVEVDMKKIKKYDIKKQEPFEVLTDTNGNILTADLDLLDVGTKKKREIMQDDELMGNIDSHDMAVVNDINRATKNKKYPNQRLTHHGGETSFINRQSKPDFPLIAHAPDGQFLIKDNAQLKAFYHHKKLQGYDLEPNPFWGWGEWDPTKGYKIKPDDINNKVEKIKKVVDKAKKINRQDYKIELLD